MCLSSAQRGEDGAISGKNRTDNDLRHFHFAANSFPYAYLKVLADNPFDSSRIFDLSIL